MIKDVCKKNISSMLYHLKVKSPTAWGLRFLLTIMDSQFDIGSY